jgi:hypothetical protein
MSKRRSTSQAVILRRRAKAAITETSFGFPVWNETLAHIRMRLQVNKLEVSERESLLDAIARIEDDLERSWQALKRRIEEDESLDHASEIADIERAREQVLDQLVRLRVTLTSHRERI